MGQLENRELLRTDLVDLIWTAVNLRHKDKSIMNDATVLVGEGLGLDSLDVLEIAVAIEKKYQIKISGAEEGKKAFVTLGTLTDFIRTQTAPSPLL